jgi:hypothetical protein
MLFPHLGPSTPTFQCTCCARQHHSSLSTSVQERLTSANALAISGKQCEPGFPDAEPFYTFHQQIWNFMYKVVQCCTASDRCHSVMARSPPVQPSYSHVTVLQAARPLVIRTVLCCHCMLYSVSKSYSTIHTSTHNFYSTFHSPSRAVE